MTKNEILGDKLKKIKRLLNLSHQSLSDELTDYAKKFRINKGYDGIPKTNLGFSKDSIIRYEKGNIPENKMLNIAKAYSGYCIKSGHILITKEIIIEKKYTANDIELLWGMASTQTIYSQLQNHLKKNEFEKLNDKLCLLKKRKDRLDLYNYFKGILSIKKRGLNTLSPELYFNSINPESVKFFINAQKELYFYYHEIYNIQESNSLFLKLNEISNSIMHSGIKHPFSHFLKELTNHPTDINKTIKNYKEFKQNFLNIFNFKTCTIQMHGTPDFDIELDGIFWAEFYATIFFIIVRLIDSFEGDQNDIIKKMQDDMQCDIAVLSHQQDVIKAGFNNFKKISLYTELVGVWKKCFKL